MVTISLDRHVGAVAPVARAADTCVAAGPGFLFVDEDGSVRELAQPEAGRTDVRMNDGACDPQGRFWAGTMAYDESPGAGALYRLELDGSCTTVLTGLTIANGIGWSPDGGTMYLNDSGTGRVETFRFDSASGAITDRRTLVHSDQPGVVPDGLTVDAEGGIWVALVGRRGRQPLRARRDRSSPVFELPVERPTSCAFGGPDLGDPVRDHRPDGLDDDALARQPDSGACSRSRASASAASRASPTAVGPHRRSEARERDPPRPTRGRAARRCGHQAAQDARPSRADSVHRQLRGLEHECRDQQHQR